MESLPVRRIHIDSRFKTDNSDSHSDFHIRLSQSVSLPDETICMVDNISIPNTFFTVQTNVNDSVYIAEKLSATSVVCRKVTLDQNYYTSSQFAAELTLKLNVGTPTVMGTSVASVTRGAVQAIVVNATSTPRARAKAAMDPIQRARETPELSARPVRARG